MAYLNFSESFCGPVASVPAAEAVGEDVTPLTGFSAIEWMVIGLAERDGLSSLATPGPIARALGGLFGLGVSSRLADARLEQLRRFAVLVRHHGWRVPTSEVKAFLTQFTAEQLETVIASATRRSTLSPQRIAA